MRSLSDSLTQLSLFSNADDNQAISNVDSSKVDTYCHSGDNICVNGDLILVPHLTYAENVAAAASFAIAAAAAKS